MRGLSAHAGGRSAYVQYVVPGILLITVAAVTAGTAISVATDMTGGIIARFRTMAISRAAVLSGHVLGATVQTVISLVVVTGVALAIGFRPTTGALDWLAAAAVLVLITLSLTWVAVAMGTVAKSVESASNMPMLLLFLPFLSSGFVPTRSLPAGVSWFARYQPFTPFIETIRGLLLGTPMGHDAVLTLGVVRGALGRRVALRPRRLRTSVGPLAAAPVVSPARSGRWRWRCRARWCCGACRAGPGRTGSRRAA